MAYQTVLTVVIFLAFYRFFAWITRKKHPLDEILTAYGSIKVRFRDAMTGTMITGATGSGKTTAMLPVMRDVMAKCGFIGFTVKDDEPASMVKIAQLVGKTPILIGRKHANRINALRYAYELAGGSVEAATALVTTLADMRRGGRDTHGKSFFTDAMANDVRYAVTILSVVPANLTMENLGKLVRSAPIEPGKFDAESDYVRFHDIAADHYRRLPKTRQLDLEAAFVHFEYSRASWSPETRTSVGATLSSVIEPMMVSPLRELLSTETNVTPFHACGGGVIVMADAIQSFGVEALTLQAAWRYLAFLAVAARKSTDTHPVAIWTDEAGRLLLKEHELMHLATCRSHHCLNYLIVQDYDQVIDAMGDKTRAGSVIANTRLKIHLKGDNQTTLEQVCKSAGKSLEAIPAPGEHKPFDPTDIWSHQAPSAGVRFEYRPNLRPTDISSLRAGGKHGYCLALVYMAGTPFRSGANHALTRMRQLFL